MKRLEVRSGAVDDIDAATDFFGQTDPHGAERRRDVLGELSIGER